MRKYSPPPHFERHDYCSCEDGTLYHSNQYFLPLFLCSSCGFAGHHPQKRTVETETGAATREREYHLNLIERMWGWVGVAAPRPLKPTRLSKKYQALVRDVEPVVRRWRAEKTHEEKD